MTHYETILLIVDPQMRESAAFRRAVQLARGAGAELSLCLFDHNPAIAALGAVNALVMEQAVRGFVDERETWLRAQAQALLAAGLRVKTQVIWGGPLHEKMLQLLIERRPSLVVKDVGVEPTLKRLLFTPLDWQLLRYCPAPLLLVNRAAEGRVRRVIAAVDPMHPGPAAGALNDRIVQEALALSIQCDADLHLLHAFEGLPPVVPADIAAAGSMYDGAYEELRRLHHARFREFAGRHGVPPDRMHLRYGPAPLALADFAADTEADVIVIGTVYRTGLERIVIGSTAERILDDLHCDVLAVKPAGFERDLQRHFGQAAYGGV